MEAHNHSRPKGHSLKPPSCTLE